MRDVDLGKGVRTSVLGFGCSALVGGRTTREALYLLEAAYDAGIRHFDVARLYGTGDAEAIVGSFSVGRRSEITIASKFGIEPPLALTRSSAAKRLLRAAARRSPLVRDLGRRVGGAVARRDSFSPESAAGSLERSLRALRTDHLDVFLLHDCAPEAWLNAGLRSLLDELVSAGRVRLVGTATSYAATLAIFRSDTLRPSVVQFANDVFTQSAPAFRGEFGDHPVITHGVFRSALRRLQSVGGDDRLVAAWSRQLDVDLRRPNALAALLLAQALEDNADGVVLFSAGSADRIRENARVAAERPFEAAQIRAFERLARGLLVAADG